MTDMLQGGLSVSSIRVLGGKNRAKSLAPWEDTDPADGFNREDTGKLYRHTCFGVTHLEAQSLKALVVDGEPCPLSRGQSVPAKDKESAKAKAYWVLPCSVRTTGFRYQPTKAGGQPRLSYQSEPDTVYLLVLDYDNTTPGVNGTLLAERVHEYLDSKDVEHVVQASVSAALTGGHDRFHVVVRLETPLVGDPADLKVDFQRHEAALVAELDRAVGRRIEWDETVHRTPMRKLYLPVRLKVGSEVLSPWFRASGSRGFVPEPSDLAAFDALPRRSSAGSTGSAWGSALRDPRLVALTHAFSESGRGLVALYQWAGVECPWEPAGEGYNYVGPLARSVSVPLKPSPGNRDDLVMYSAEGHGDHPDARSGAAYVNGPGTYIFFRYQAALNGFTSLSDQEFDEQMTKVMEPLLARVPEELPEEYAEAARQVASELPSFSAVTPSESGEAGSSGVARDDLNAALVAYRQKFDKKLGGSLSAAESRLVEKHSAVLARVTRSSTSGGLMLDGLPLENNGDGDDSMADLVGMVIDEISPAIADRTETAVTAAVQRVCASNHNRVSPFRGYLLGLKWDGECRLGALPVPGAEDCEYNRLVMRELYLTFALRGLFPGAHGRHAFVFHGVSGSGKSELTYKFLPGGRLSAVPGETLLQGDTGGGYSYTQAMMRALSCMSVTVNERFSYGFGRGSIDPDSAKDVLDQANPEMRRMRQDDGMMLGRRGYVLFLTTNYPHVMPDDAVGRTPGLYPDLALCDRLVPVEIDQRFDKRLPAEENPPLARALHEFLQPGADWLKEQLLAEAVAWVLQELEDRGTDVQAALADQVRVPLAAESVSHKIESVVPLNHPERARQLLMLQQKADVLPRLESVVAGAPVVNGRVRLTFDAVRVADPDLEGARRTVMLWSELLTGRSPAGDYVVDVPAEVQTRLLSRGVALSPWTTVGEEVA